MTSSLQRTKVYFAVVAVVTSACLFTYVYKENIFSTELKLTPFNNSFLGNIHLRDVSYTVVTNAKNNTNHKLISERLSTKITPKLVNNISPGPEDIVTTVSSKSGSIEINGKPEQNGNEDISNELENGKAKNGNNVDVIDGDIKDDGGFNDKDDDDDDDDYDDGVFDEDLENDKTSHHTTGLLEPLTFPAKQTTVTAKTLPGADHKTGTKQTPTANKSLDANKQNIIEGADPTNGDSKYKDPKVDGSKGILSISEKEKIRERIKMLRDELKDFETTFDSRQANQSELNRKQHHRVKSVRDKLRGLGLSDRNGFVFENKELTSDARSNVGISRPDDCTGCFNTDFPELVNNPDLCKNSPVDVLIIITSTSQNYIARNSIRKTWGTACNRPETNIKCVFFFGNKNDAVANDELLKEGKKSQDIVQVDFHDSYANLTYKTIVSLKWSQKYCNNAKYVFKTDDDMYVNTDLLPLLAKGAPEKDFIGGFCWGPSPPHRDRSSKWFVSFNQYTHSYFPSMCSGTGYIMSRDVVIGIIKSSANTPFFHLEDVYVAICVKRLGIHPVLLSGFKNTMVEFQACTYRNVWITVHGFHGNDLEHIWEKSRSCPLNSVNPEDVYQPIQM